MNKKDAKKEKSVLRLSHGEARSFFLKSESYCNVDLPDYFHFGGLIEKVAAELKSKSLASLSKTPREHERVNHSILSNKDGRHAWRPFQLIHPAIYVSLVSEITDRPNWEIIKKRFSDFESLPNFKCLSVPVKSISRKRTDKAAQVLQWWSGVEQASVAMALDYNYVFHADISDCYSSIY